jgi:hypothetical protein
LLNHSKAIISVTLGFHCVKVPVLSIAIVVIFEVFSKVEASLIKILFLAHIQVHTATAVGVASQRASGQAITIAEIAKFKDVIIDTFQNKYQLKKVIIQDKIASITKYQAALSAKRCQGAFEF